MRRARSNAGAEADFESLMRNVVFVLFVTTAIHARAAVTATAVVPHLAWGTNIATITLQNDATPRTVTINIHARNEDVGGVGWDTTHPLAADERLTVARDFYIRPLPGRVTVALTVTAGGATVLEQRYTDRFRAGHAPMRPVQITSKLWRSGPLPVPSRVTAYRPLHAITRPPLVFYVLPDDRYAKAHLNRLWRQRVAALRRLNAKLGTRQCEPIAFYLFPDATTKFAYMFHQGNGWAAGGRAIVEIFNAHQQLDPNHELVHIVSAALGEPPALFNEGLATYLQKGAAWEGRPVDDWVREFARGKRLVPIAELLRYTDIGPQGTQPAVTYPEAASFVKFVDGRYGTPTLLRAFEALKSSDDPAWQEENAQKFESIFHATPAELETTWLHGLGVR